MGNHFKGIQKFEGHVKSCLHVQELNVNIYLCISITLTYTLSIEWDNICNCAIMVCVFTFTVYCYRKAQAEIYFSFGRWGPIQVIAHENYRMDRGTYLRSLIKHLRSDFSEWLSNLIRSLKYCCAYKWARQRTLLRRRRYSGGHRRTQLTAGKAGRCPVPVSFCPLVLSQSHTRKQQN